MHASKVTKPCLYNVYPGFGGQQRYQKKALEEKSVYEEKLATYKGEKSKQADLSGPCPSFATHE